jgi:hypothetical protein
MRRLRTICLRVPILASFAGSALLVLDNQASHLFKERLTHRIARRPMLPEETSSAQRF